MSVLDGYTWDMTGYIQRHGYRILDHGLTRMESERIFQLAPEPPVMDDLNDYILAALREKNLNYFSFFLHHYERQLNARIYTFRRHDGDMRYDPERMVDMKMACMEIMLAKLPDYDPDKGAAFATYIYPFIKDALLRYRMGVEAWSIASLDAYKKLRTVAWLYYCMERPLEEFTDRNNCSAELAYEYLQTARGIRRRKPFLATFREEESEVTGEDVTRDDSWNYTAVLWNREQANAVQRAFEKLDYKEQKYLEQRNAICMDCGHVGPWQDRLSFEELAVMFEGSTSSGAERAYRRAVEHLIVLLAEEGALHAVRLKQKSKKRRKKKTAAAVYEYQADCDGEWGEIEFNFESGTAEIVQLADWDTTKSQLYAKQAIRYLLGQANDKLPKEAVIAFPHRTDDHPWLPYLSASAMVPRSFFCI